MRCPIIFSRIFRADMSAVPRRRGSCFFMGFSVDRAEDGIFCVDELEKAPDGTYDRMLVDIQMPNMDGYKATKIIRRLPEEESGYPILAMTANAFATDRKKALEMGRNGTLQNPSTGKRFRVHWHPS